MLVPVLLIIYFKKLAKASNPKKLKNFRQQEMDFSFGLNVVKHM